MPYRGDQVHAARRSADGTNRLLVVLGAASLAYPVARALFDMLWRVPWETQADPTELRFYRIVGYFVFALHALPAIVALLLARKAASRDLRLLYGMGGVSMLLGLGLELVPIETIAVFRWTRFVTNLLISASLAAIAAGVARTRRASEDDDTGVLLSSVVALAVGSIVETAWWIFDGYMRRPAYGWYSSSLDTGIDGLLSNATLVFFLAPLVCLGIGALVRARARDRAPIVDDRAREREDAEANAVVLRLRTARNVLVAFALAVLAASLPTLVLLAAVMAKSSGPVGVRQVARVLVFLQGIFAASLAMAFFASAGDEVKNDERPMRTGVFVALLFQLSVIVALLGDEPLGLTKLDIDVACGLWSAGAAASIFGHAELARGILARGVGFASTADDIPETIVPFVEELRRLVRFVAIGAAMSIGMLFLGHRAHDASTITTLWVLGSFATIGCGAGALIGAARARRVLDRAILWRLAGKR